MSSIEVDGRSCLLATARDITEHKRTEQALRDASEAAEEARQAEQERRPRSERLDFEDCFIEGEDGGGRHLIVREGVILTAAGLAIGMLLSAGVARLLSSMLYEVGAFDPLAFLVAPAILAFASLLATYLPARRATSVDPLVALRSD